MSLLLLLACGAPSTPAPAAALPPPEVAPAPPPVAPPTIPLQVDLHLDTPTQMVRRKVGLDDPALEAGLPALLKGGTNVAVMVLWPPQKADWAASVETLLKKVEEEDKRLESVEIARSPEEAQAVADRGHVALLLSLEGAHGIDKEGIAGLERLHARGLSLLGLTWSFSNRFAGSSGDNGGGLTEEGRALIAAANRLGIVVDVSHASRATTLEACALSSSPVIASHSDAYATHAQARNLSDPEIQCICKAGGVIGLNFHSTFVGHDASAQRLVDHADHIASLGGRGCVALGSDFDGLIKPPPDLTSAGDLPTLWSEFRKRGWSESEIGNVKGNNFMRTWRQVRP